MVLTLNFNILTFYPHILEFSVSLCACSLLCVCYAAFGCHIAINDDDDDDECTQRLVILHEQTY